MGAVVVDADLDLVRAWNRWWVESAKHARDAHAPRMTSGLVTVPPLLSGGRTSIQTYTVPASRNVCELFLNHAATRSLFAVEVRAWEWCGLFAPGVSILVSSPVMGRAAALLFISDMWGVRSSV